MKESQLSRLVRHIWAEVKLAAWVVAASGRESTMTIRAEFSVGLNHLFEIMDRLVAAIHSFLLKTRK